ncbi:deaminase domain-containing protein [Peribacillus sp. NPDC097198]|uniref:deaminase domain-containing protein n=1 Tax=Peribacillus sp. NPDC097198 TaxID=3364397 RepID=UPI003804ED1C
MANGTKFIPYSKEFVQNQVQKAQDSIKDMGKALGKVEVPTGVKVRTVADTTGNTYKNISVDKTTIKDLAQKVTAKGDGSKGTGKVYPTRQIDSVAEAHIVDRVKELRGNLPSKYKKSGNFALAEVNVSGINKSEFYAQSRINNLKGNLEDKVPDISLQPENPMFKATKAVGKDGESYLRDTDTEYKILNDIASRLGENTQATGKIKLFTELDTCDSCCRVIADFSAKYKNISLEIVHNDGNRIIN